MFPVTNIISTKQPFQLFVDPTAQEPILDPKSTKIDTNSSLVTMEVTFDPDLQIFKNLLILIAKGNAQALTSFAQQNTLKKIDMIIEKALDCQGTCYIECDDVETFESLIQAKKIPTGSITLTAKLTFVPMQAILEQALAETSQNEQNK